MNFDKITGYLEGLDRKVVPGIDMAVYQNHQPVYRHFSGFRDRENGIPMDGKELYWAYSCTKVLTVTAAMQLFEKGLIGLDDAVGKYLPAYDVLAVSDNGRIRAPKTPMTIRHLFTMTAGLSYDLEAPSIQKTLFYSGNKADTITLVNSFAEEPLGFDPGERFRYSLCHDVLAAIVEVVSGERFADYVARHIFKPLGIKRSGFHGEDISEFAVQYAYNSDTKTSSPCGMGNVFRLSHNYDSGGAGLFTSVDDYIKLSDALACGGVGMTGERILKAPTIDLIRLPQLGEQQLKDFKANIISAGKQYSYGFGVRTMVEEDGSIKSPIGEFGWDGAASSYTLIDPKNQLSIFIGMHILGFNHVSCVMQHELRDMTYECMEENR